MTNHIASSHIEIALGCIKRAEFDLRRALSQGERRDLLLDNTTWTSEVVAAVVRIIARERGV